MKENKKNINHVHVKLVKSNQNMSTQRWNNSTCPVCLTIMSNYKSDFLPEGRRVYKLISFILTFTRQETLLGVVDVSLSADALALLEVREVFSSQGCDWNNADPISL